MARPNLLKNPSKYEAYDVVVSLDDVKKGVVRLRLRSKKKGNSNIAGNKKKGKGKTKGKGS